LQHLVVAGRAVLTQAQPERQRGKPEGRSVVQLPLESTVTCPARLVPPREGHVQLPWMLPVFRHLVDLSAKRDRRRKDASR
jgi:hypothetical protein